jgi:hypothetical protein
MTSSLNSLGAELTPTQLAQASGGMWLAWWLAGIALAVVMILTAAG